MTTRISKRLEDKGLYFQIYKGTTIKEVEIDRYSPKSK